ncbi:transcriptional repressor [Amylibacter sp. SFDW26]|uniref:Fur family transcriptional regulator n=1 Tax=Amylibacter sp. SFDW26 TaxID=2652722 RepID=UPI001261A463|nr:Fur family transcriptional regulator [Amylibacter sp. SFDW26]KAB7610028.1 transcriptional repressor [Amylibacter sp. SFDW26]
MSVGFENHDHTFCIQDALETADTYCSENGLQFTKTRRRVLEILLMQHKALGAYDILAHLSDEGLGAQPPVVYRALDFLVTNGFAHKIEKLNAYSACSHPGISHSPVFMICRVCENIVETKTEPLHSFLGTTAEAAGFSIEDTVIEVEGVCPSCQKSAQI